MTVWYIPRSIDVTIEHMLPDIMSHPNPATATNRIAADAAHYLAGWLLQDTISGKDLERLLHSLRAFAKARRVELDDIAANGNLFARDWESTITCADGFKHTFAAHVERMDRVAAPAPGRCLLSVVAGFAAYCTPRPGYGDVPRDYRGPYTAVEVMPLNAPMPEGWRNDGGIAGWVPVEDVRALIESHGGEQ